MEIRWNRELNMSGFQCHVNNVGFLGNLMQGVRSSLKCNNNG